MTAVEDLKAPILDSLSRTKEEERINYLIDSLIEAKIKSKSESEQLQNAQIHITQLEKKVKFLEEMLSKTEVAKTKFQDLCRVLNESAKEIQENSKKKIELLQEQHQLALDKFRKSTDPENKK